MIGNRIKELRIKHNLTQAQLGKILGYNQNQISRWEKGVLEPDINTIKKIALFFEVSADFLIGLREEPQIMFSEEFSYTDGIHTINHKKGSNE